MMRCDKCRGQLANYIGGMLSDQDRLVLEEHIEQCPDCQQVLEDLRELDARLREEVPPLWEAIKPTPQFMAQLKHMELEASPKPTIGIADWFSSLWSNHRMALATGLSVCLVIALVFSGVFDFGGGAEDDNDETVASQEFTTDEGYPETAMAPTATQTRESLLSMEAGGFAADNQEDSVRSEKGPVDLDESIDAAVTDFPARPGESIPTTTLPPMTTPSSIYSVEAPSEADAWDCTAEWSYDGTQQAPTILGYTPDEVEKAIKIAIESMELLEAIEEHDLDHIAVSADDNESFICDGLTIILIREDSCIYTCIDVDAGEMTSHAIYPREP